MAVMIPETPREFKPESQEGAMFAALETLPDSYYVIHSYKIVNVDENNQLRESETDFVIYNREKGILCLEAKAGSGIGYRDGAWRYTSGKAMKYDGPYNQASRGKYRIQHLLEESKFSDILSRCKLLHGVWFPGISISQLKAMAFPQEGDRNITLTSEALTDPKEFIEKIFDITPSYKGKPVSETIISESESKILIREYFCPEFEIFPAASYFNDLKKLAFHRLLQEQTNILNFLEDQQVAAINGAAGTGKTMIAAEKARRNAAAGDKVLFLCYNTKLCEYLEDNYGHENIDYMTISKLAVKMCGSNDFAKLSKKLNDIYGLDLFPYKHIIVDEGQDFGKDEIEEADILDQLRALVEDVGTFYVFYDRLQLIQSDKLPSFLENADCRVTLYRNCRNTENIATTSLRPISDRKPKLRDGAVKGAPANMYFCNDKAAVISRLNEILGTYKGQKHDEIVILTTETEERSILSGEVKNGLYANKYQFTTCRKFKGLEADVVILVDVTKDTFKPDNVLRFYVGTSRARLNLDMLGILSDDDCTAVLQDDMQYQGKIRKPRRELATALNAKAIIPD